MASAVTSELLPVVPPLLKRLISIFPREYFRFCFAYGSGVFEQSGVKVGQPMIDFVFAVDDSGGFHDQNIQMNPSHYSSARRLGPNVVTLIQEKWPAKVYFNPLIPVKSENVLIKYGVVNKRDLVNELLDWDYLYLAGRLHKPIKIVEPAVAGDEIEMALRQNLLSALHAAFLILPEHFTERDLYTTITSLSYNGDFRMMFGEDKNKVKNIVDKQVLEFRKLYRPLMPIFSEFVEIPDGSVDQPCVQDLSVTARMYHLFQLPKVPMQELVRYWRRHGGRKSKDTEEALHDLAFHPDVSSMLLQTLSTIVFRSSLIQSLKGLVSAGFYKSVIYSNKKVQKMLKSWN